MQQKRSEEVKRSILETTMHIIKEDGFEAVSIRKISERMGYTSGVIYYHFKDKQEIIDTIHNEANRDIQRIVKENFKEDASFFENIKSVFHGIMLIAITRKEMFDLILFDKFSTRKEKINQWLKIIENALKKAIDKGEIRKVNVSETAFSMWSSYLGFNFMLWKIDSIDLEKAEEMFETMTDMIFNGLYA